MASSIDRRRLIFAILISVGVLVLLTVAIVLVIYTATKHNNPYGSNIPIKNYGLVIKNIPQEYEDQITSQLLNTVTLNTPDVKPNSINDAIIRAGSATQDIVTPNTQYSGSFIVDLASLKQSYFIQYSYSTKPDDGFMSGYPIAVQCLDKSKLIYGDFNCKDSFNIDDTTLSDPTIADLPYSTLDYTLQANVDNTGKLTLNATIILSDIDYQTGIDSAIMQKEQEIKDWITSKGFDPSKYSIIYSH